MRRGRVLYALVVTAAVAVVLPSASVPARSAITPDRSGGALAGAMASPGTTVVGAAFETAPPAGNPNAVSTTALTSFPTSGPSYAILSSGEATLAERPNDAPNSGAADGGGPVRGASEADVTIFRVDLQVPSGANCVAFDFRFLTEEFPEYVGQGFNDAFVAELDQSTWSTSESGSVSAPNNFAFDPGGNPVTVNAAGAASVTPEHAAGTTYDGATPVLRAATPVSAGRHSVYFSIFDQGDDAFDSAVFVDRLTVGTTPAGGCKAGANPVTGTPDQPLLDLGAPVLPDLNPLADTSSFSLSVQQNGTVTARPAGGPAAAMRCGVGGSACFQRLDRDTRVVLTASPSRGYVFTKWTGSCSGRSPRCTVGLGKDRSVTAVFAPKRGVAAVGASLARPRFTVGWDASIGKGQLVVRGRVTRAARLRLELRRPGGAPLLVRRVSVPGGQFRTAASLGPGKLKGGAILLPGGFVVVLRGTSGPLQVPIQLQTVVLPAPPEGVVRRSFASASETGAAAPTLPPNTKEAWAHFVFEAQPRSGQKLSVSWFNPAGQLVGTIEKPNRPEVVSFARAEPGLANGLWRVELRAGTKLVKTLAVRVGPGSSAFASGTPLTLKFFHLPSNNIGCAYSSPPANLRCDVLSGLKPRPKKKCELDWTGLGMSAIGRAGPVCAGDTAVDRRSPVLRYGQTWKRGGFTCTARLVGLTCRNRSGHGFFLSRQRWRVF